MAIRRFFSAVTLLGIFTFSAAAADLSVRAPSISRAPAAVAVFNWTGFYIGGHVGYGLAEIDSTVVTASTSFPAGFAFATSRPQGVLGGGQIGFNWQTGNFVFGVEAEGSWTDIQDDARRSNSPIIAGNFVTTDREVDWLATVAGRFGFTMDNYFLYAKAGWAWAKLESASETRNALNALLATTTSSATRDGWLAGVGLEVGFVPNWSFKIEYNFIDLGTETNQSTSTGVPSILLREVDAQIHIVKVGVNYRFGGGVSPIVARY